MSHYFLTPPGGGEPTGTVQLRVGAVDVPLLTSAGVFSRHRVDLGTQVLLELAPAPSTGHILDLGCGYGPIAVWAAFNAPGATIWAVDVNDQALALARVNCQRLALDHVMVARPEDVEQQDFDSIYSNPAIRIGKEALHKMLRLWLPRLRPQGVAYLVVARNLGADSLHRWLTGEGWHVQRRGTRGGYRVLACTRPD